MPLIETQPDALATIYARSLFDLAKAKGAQQQIEDTGGELEAVLELARADARFGEFLASRIVAVKDRERALRAIFQGRISDLVLHFLLVLNENARLDRLVGVVAAYDQLVQHAFGRVEVDVYTASPVPDDELAALKGRLQQSLGKEPVLHTYTQPQMIGGIKLQIGDQLIDASVAAQLRKLHEQMSANGTASVKAAADRLIRPDPSTNGH